MGVDVRQLRAFVAVVEEGTFTDAAIALHTSQASVSRAVADLERAVGVRLLQRTSHGAVATPIGREAVEYARRLLAEVMALETLGERTGSKLRVGFAWSVFGRLTTAIERDWRRAFPDQELTWLQSNTSWVGLLDGECDIAILRRPLADARFETHLVGTEPRVVAVAADDPLSRQRGLTLLQLGDRVVAIDRSTGTTSTELWPGEATPEVREVHGIEEWLTVVASGSAVGVTSEATAEQFPRPGIRYRRLRAAAPIPVWLAWWRDNPPAGGEKFRQLVCEHYARR